MMPVMRVLFALMLVLVTAVPAAYAQNGEPTRPPSATPEAEPSKAAETGTPYSVDRVRRQLRLLPPTTIVERRDGLKLEYYIQVYGQAPPIDLFKEFNVKTGPVPNSAPTHADMLEQMTPQEFRAPAMDLNSLFAWITKQLSRK
jgi:hypothetical protein